MERALTDLPGSPIVTGSCPDWGRAAQSVISGRCNGAQCSKPQREICHRTACGRIPVLGENCDQIASHARRSLYELLMKDALEIAPRPSRKATTVELDRMLTGSVN